MQNKKEVSSTPMQITINKKVLVIGSIAFVVVLTVLGIRQFGYSKLSKEIDKAYDIVQDYEKLMDKTVNVSPTKDNYATMQRFSELSESDIKSLRNMIEEVDTKGMLLIYPGDMNKKKAIETSINTITKGLDALQTLADYYKTNSATIQGYYELREGYEQDILDTSRYYRNVGNTVESKYSYYANMSFSYLSSSTYNLASNKKAVTNTQAGLNLIKSDSAQAKEINQLYVTNIAEELASVNRLINLQTAYTNAYNANQSKYGVKKPIYVGGYRYLTTSCTGTCANKQASLRKSYEGKYFAEVETLKGILKYNDTQLKELFTKFASEWVKDLKENKKTLK